MNTTTGSSSNSNNEARHLSLSDTRLNDFLPMSLQLENLTNNLSNTVSTTASMLFSPLTHRAVKGDTVAILSELAPQLMDQRRIQQYVGSSARHAKEGSSRLAITPDDYPIRVSKPNPKELLVNAEIPESKAPLSLLQGYRATFSEVETLKENGKKRGKPNKRKIKGLLTETLSTSDVMSETASIDNEHKPLNQLIADRDRVVRENDRLHLQESRTISDIKRIELEIAALTAQKLNLEENLVKYKERKVELVEQLEDLNERITIFAQENGCSERRTRGIKGPKHKPGTCIKVLEGHEDMIICLDLDKPYGRLVTASLDNTLRLWDLSSYRSLGILEGHEGVVNCLQLKGRHLVTGSRDRTIRQWDISKLALRNESVTNLTELNFKSGSAPEQNGLSFVGEDCWLATLEGHGGSVSGSSDKTMKQWDMETGQCILTMDILWAMSSSKAERRHAGFLSDGYTFDQGDFIGALQFRDIGLASGTQDGAIRMWDSL
ncbi:6265_t:CDS:2 [Acaulospora colombiana]|uniref:6265_t:CDS:1 n=1 Tax=Acaulospora colombiana TaxID=27376 RepID=A0ACA9JX36_9GLOM|nr:6265_t:CDS:2 [Acaulospora colombiana]